MIAMLLLAAADTEPGEIVHDYMETVRLGGLRAAAANRDNDEAQIEAFCRSLGTTTEDAFRDAVSGLDLSAVLNTAQFSQRDREALMTWRQSISQ